MPTRLFFTYTRVENGKNRLNCEHGYDLWDTDLRFIRVICNNNNNLYTNDKTKLIFCNSKIIKVGTQFGYKNDKSQDLIRTNDYIKVGTQLGLI